MSNSNKISVNVKNEALKLCSCRYPIIHLSEFKLSVNK